MKWLPLLHTITVGRGGGISPEETARGLLAPFRELGGDGQAGTRDGFVGRDEVAAGFDEALDAFGEGRGGGAPVVGGIAERRQREACVATGLGRGRIGSVADSRPEAACSWSAVVV